MMKKLKMALRGTRRLPHVGEHPGTPLMMIMIAIGFLIGLSKGSLSEAMFTASFMAIWIVPLYLYGGYDRARISDRISSAQKTVPADTPGE